MSACLPDNALWHASARDCSTVAAFYLGILVEMSVLTVGFFCVVAFKWQQVRRKNSTGRGALFGLLVAHQLLVVALAVSEFAQSGFFEAASVVSIGLVVTVFLAFRTIVRVSLNPSLFVHATGEDKLKRVLWIFDVYGVSVFIANWFVLASMIAFARTQTFNLLMAVFLLVCTLGSGLAQFVYLFVALFLLERSLRETLVRLPVEAHEASKAIELVLIKLRRLRRSFLFFASTNAIFPTAVGIYMLVARTFPVGIPLSAVLYGLGIHGFCIVSLALYSFILDDKRNTTTTTTSSSAMITSSAPETPGLEGDQQVDLRFLASEVNEEEMRTV